MESKHGIDISCTSFAGPIERIVTKPSRYIPVSSIRQVGYLLSSLFKKDPRIKRNFSVHRTQKHKRVGKKFAKPLLFPDIM